MTTSDRDTPGVLDALDSALVRAITGALWFPLIYLPRQLQRLFPLTVKLARVGVLFAAWAAFVFAPLAFLDDVRDPVTGTVIVAWTALTLVGSLLGVLRHRRTEPARARARAHGNKPADLADAFV